jgi:hypothetical protein
MRGVGMLVLLSCVAALALSSTSHAIDMPSSTVSASASASQCLPVGYQMRAAAPQFGVLSKAFSSGQPLLTAEERKAAAIRDSPGTIRIDWNPALRESPLNPYPWLYLPAKEGVTRNAITIERAAETFGVEPDLIKAIVWNETTHGWYDDYVGLVRNPRSILPMNINAEYWSELGCTRSDLENGAINIFVGAYIVAYLQKHLDDDQPEKVGTLYQDLAATTVSMSGITTANYYRTRPWQLTATQ